MNGNYQKKVGKVIDTNQRSLIVLSNRAEMFVLSFNQMFNEAHMYFQTVKDNCNPVYDVTFEYILSQGELNSRQLEVSVVTRKGWFSSQSPVMGQVCDILH